MSRESLGRGNRERLDTVDRVPDAPNDGSRVGREQRRPRAGTELVWVRAPEEVDQAVPVRLGRCKYDVVRPGDRLHERVVVLRRRVEQDVECDHLGAVGAEAIDQSRVHGPPIRPAHAQVAQRLVVDLDEDDVLRRRLRPAHVEPQVDRVELEPLHHVQSQGGERKCARRQSDAQEQQGPEASPTVRHQCGLAT